MRAADAVKIERTLHYRWLKSSEKYTAAFKRAKEEFGDVLEGEAIRRANEGTLEPVFYQGAACGAIRVYSDGLMQFLLKGAKPEKYGNKAAIEVSGPNGGPIPVTNAGLAALTDEELAAFIAAAEKFTAVEEHAGSGRNAGGDATPATEKD